LTQPRARLSRTESRGKIFSCLGELLWYLAGSDDLTFIRYYLSHYVNESDNGRTIHAAYGPRLFHFRRQDQFGNVVRLLRRNPFSRRAVIQLFDATDLAGRYRHVPCTCTLQFLVREGRLTLVTSMRSNDVFWGLAHDIFAFTMLQEIVARRVGVELGPYFHMVGSLHLYRTHRQRAQRFLDEGWQSTRPMRAMPRGDPRHSIRRLLAAELAIRTGRKFSLSRTLDAYWADLIRLLQVFGYARRDQADAIMAIKRKMSSRMFDVYIDDRKVRAALRQDASGHQRRTNPSLRHPR
jgi:thymidylate synthase